MSKKIIDRNIVQTAPNTELKTRRKALKSLLVASGVVAGSQTLAKEWARPLVESVVLPAHAQTSLVAAGTFGSGVVSVKLDNRQPWYAKSNLLDSLITPANASTSRYTSIRDSICGDHNRMSVLGGDGGAYEIMFNIEGNLVTVCISSLGQHSSSDLFCTQQASGTLDGQKIIVAEDILMDGSESAAEHEVIRLTNILINDTLDTITGSLEVVQGPDNTRTRYAACGAGNFECTQTASTYTCDLLCTTK